MAPDPVTIDNLPPEHNNRWAQDQQNPALGQIKEDRFIKGQAQVDVTESAYSSALTALMGEDLSNIRWSNFEPPAIFFTARRSDLFTDELIPRLGNNEKLKVVKERLESLPEVLYGG